MRGRDTLVTLLWHQRTATVSRRLAPALSHLLSLFHTFHTSCLSLTPLVSPRLAPAVCHALKLPLYHTHTSPFPHSLPLFFVNAHLYVRERERERERESLCVCVNWVEYWQRVREGAAVSDQQVSHLPLCSRVLVADQGQHHARRNKTHSRRKLNKQEVDRGEVRAHSRAHTHTHLHRERE
jgi:hypothetical protein